MADYFKSHIYNNFYNSALTDNECTYAVLSHKDEFMCHDAVNYVNSSGSVKNIIILLSGQQSPPREADHDDDIKFSMRLTGGDRITDNSNDGPFWNGQYKIAASGKYKSIASKLFDSHGNTSIILDVLNTKFDWLKNTENKESTFDYILSVIFDKLYDKFTDKNKIKFFICGFSRGALLALLLAKKFSKMNLSDKISGIVIIDTIINPGKKEEVDLADEWYLRKNSIWTKQSKRPSAFFYEYYDFFPVLKSLDNIKYFNVFQRRGMGNFDTIKWPIGGAVKNAESLIKFAENVIPESDADGNLYQYDSTTEGHTPYMLDTYKNPVLKIADTLLSV